jgi:DnaJ-class molecular chaperone
MAKCRRCKGSGQVPAGGKFDGYKECPYCGGDGEDIKCEELEYPGVNQGKGPSRDWNTWE